MQTWVIEAAGLTALQRLAERLSLFVRRGDVITLEGGLGAGKTAFARFLIQAMLGADAQEDIPSPTFSLVQSYETARMGVHHYDFYRLGEAEEALELGLGQDDGAALKLIEWPERVAEFLPNDRLNILLEDAGTPGVTCAEDERRLTLTGTGPWAQRLARLEALDGFLQRAGWGGGVVSYLQGDASARAYGRIVDGAREAVLMDSPRAADGPPVRDGKSYSAIAHLAEDVTPFVAVAQALEGAGVRVPRIFAHDLDQGFLLIEDLGEGVFTREVADGHVLGELYRPAVDVLLALRASPPPAVLPVAGGGEYALPTYDAGALMIEVELLTDWYWPWAKGAAAPAAAQEAFAALWRPLAEDVARDAEAWVLRDFHSPNLMWMGGEGLLRVGVLDFQDALKGHSAYDLVSLLQDARLDVPDALEEELLAYYCQACAEEADFDEARFRLRYATIGAQRNTKILGIFTRLAQRDNKQAYLAHLPRIWRYLKKDLSHPGLQELRRWYADNFPDEFGAADRRS